MHAAVSSLSGHAIVVHSLSIGMTDLCPYQGDFRWILTNHLREAGGGRGTLKKYLRVNKNEKLGRRALAAKIMREIPHSQMPHPRHSQTEG